MPLPHTLAVLPKYLNPVLRPMAAYVPPLAVVHHRGRRTGTSYRSPVQAYGTPNGVIIGLAYSTKPNWALNVIAGGGELTRLGKTATIINPRLRGPEAAAHLPVAVAKLFRQLEITDYFECDLASRR